MKKFHNLIKKQQPERYKPETGPKKGETKEEMEERVRLLLDELEGVTERIHGASRDIPMNEKILDLALP